MVGTAPTQLPIFDDSDPQPKHVLPHPSGMWAWPVARGIRHRENKNVMERKEPITDIAHAVIALERAALERWGRGDPSGFLEISADDVVYFDPFQARRLNGIEELRALYESIRGQVQIKRFELIDPHVQVIGDAAVLTFNYVAEDANEATSRWNCTEVYRRDGDTWRIVQTHWSFTQPSLAVSASST